MTWNRARFRELVSPPAVGMIHLPALPGSPGWQGDMAAVRRRAQEDAAALHEGGIRAFMVENYHDVPFHPDSVPAVTVAAMTVVAADLRDAWPECRLGINVLRNDVDAALSVAAATGADFVRCNVHVGAAVTDQGPLTGEAWRTLRRRRELGVEVGILADVRVKHARPMVERPLAEEAADLRLRGLADAVIVTGPATGAAADADDLAAIRAALPDCPLLVGSGVDAESVGDLLRHADGVIIGTSLQSDGRICPRRTEHFIDSLGRATAGGNP